MNKPIKQTKLRRKITNKFSNSKIAATAHHFSHKELNLGSSITLAFISIAFASPALAESSINPTTETNEQLISETTATPSTNQPIQELIDDGHKGVSNRIDDWANKMNGWFGKPDLNEPASATLRVILDTRWEDDPISGSNVTVEPRIRGRLTLPVLERRLSVILGDEDLDEETVLRGQSTGQNYHYETRDKNKVLDRKKARDDNASIALRWSKIEDALGIDADIGVRSGDDVFVKFTVDKNLYQGEQFSIDNENFYRYGTDSEHYAKGSLNVRYGQNDARYINNLTTLRYEHQDDDENTYWGNDLRQVHNFNNHKQLSYGISTDGYFENGNAELNSYGPAISYRQPVWRDWFFVQTELTYYNDKLADKDHYPSALLRLEALF